MGPKLQEYQETKKLSLGPTSSVAGESAQVPYLHAIGENPSSYEHPSVTVQRVYMNQMEHETSQSRLNSQTFRAGLISDAASDTIPFNATLTQAPKTQSNFGRMTV